MDPYEGPLTALNIALHIKLYLDIIMDHYERLLTALTIALHRGLYIYITMDRYGGPSLPL
jgi:hypothetical protein